jgi:nucleoside-diphosphate-sugar epimerase
MDKLAPAEAINLGSGTPTTFTELAGLSAKLAGHNAQIVNDLTKPEGVFARVADTGRLSRYFSPSVSLQEGIERALAYQRTGGQAT